MTHKFLLDRCFFVFSYHYGLKSRNPYNLIFAHTGKIKIVVAGGTSKADGYIEKLNEKLLEADFPLEIDVVKHSEDPLRAVVRGTGIALKNLGSFKAVLMT